MTKAYIRDRSTALKFPALAADTESMPTLTPSEITALTLASRGHTVRESASMQRLSPETVKSHLSIARLKLGARNTTHAVALHLAA